MEIVDTEIEIAVLYKEEFYVKLSTMNGSTDRTGYVEINKCGLKDELFKYSFCAPLLFCLSKL